MIPDLRMRKPSEIKNGKNPIENLLTREGIKNLRKTEERDLLKVKAQVLRKEKGQLKNVFMFF